MTDLNHNHEPEDADVDRVLRAAGRRIQPPEDITRAVREAVQSEWQATVDAQRAKRRRWRVVAAAAGILAVAFAIWASRPLLEKPVVSVANVVRVTGAVTSTSGLWPRENAISERQVLHAGEELTTGASGRVALAFADGVSVRLDRDTRIDLIDAQRLIVRAGAVYVDAQAQRGTKNHLALETPAGSVYHLGTQYEVRLVGPGVRIRVREGEVELAQRGGVSQRGRAGEQLVVLPGGLVERTSVATYGVDWEWVGETAPTFEIDGRSLPDFLTWAAREMGREIVFSTPESQAEAARIMLSGSVSGLSPAEALATVLPTTGFRSTERDGQLVISLEADAR